MGQRQLRQWKRKILEKALSCSFQVLGRKLNAAAYLLIYMGAVCIANFPFDQMSKETCEDPIIILNKMSFNCHETSISSQLFLCSHLKEQGKEK